MFLIKEGFTQSLYLIRKPKPERQSVRKLGSSSSVAPGATSCLILFNGCAHLRAGLAGSTQASWLSRSWTTWRSSPHLQHAAVLGACWGMLWAELCGRGGLGVNQGMEQVLMLKSWKRQLHPTLLFSSPGALLWSVVHWRALSHLPKSFDTVSYYLVLLVLFGVLLVHRDQALRAYDKWYELERQAASYCKESHFFTVNM